MKSNAISRWQLKLSQGHTETWLATVITLWGVGVILFSWWLVSTKHEAAKWVLAGILLYEVLP